MKNTLKNIWLWITLFIIGLVSSVVAIVTGSVLCFVSGLVFMLSGFAGLILKLIKPASAPKKYNTGEKVASKTGTVENRISKTGFYLVEGDRLKPLNKLPGEGSINSVSASLGYSNSQTHIVFTNKSDKIDWIVFKRRSKIPLFIFVENKDISLSRRDVKEVIDGIDWKFENRQLDFEDERVKRPISLMGWVMMGIAVVIVLSIIGNMSNTTYFDPKTESKVYNPQPDKNNDAMTTGIWNVSERTNAFGDGMGDLYVSAYATNGKFSNSATINSSLSYYLSIYKEVIMISFLEYGKYPATGETDMDFQVKGADGNIISFTAGRLRGSIFIDSPAKEALLKVLLEGGNIKFSCSPAKYDISRYYFEIHDASYLANALDLAGIKY
jgi:hypothetical protein